MPEKKLTLLFLRQFAMETAELHWIVSCRCYMLMLTLCLHKDKASHKGAISEVFGKAAEPDQQCRKGNLRRVKSLRATVLL